MKLSPPQLRSILRTLHKSQSGREKRRSQRSNVSAVIRFAPIGGPTPARWIVAVTRDLSDSGMGLVTTEPLNSGEKVALRLPVDSRFLLVTCNVAHAQAVGDGLMLVGLEFIAALEATPAAGVATSRA
jgi:hypothetical protein